MVIVRKDLIGNEMDICPTMLKYSTQAGKNNSLYCDLIQHTSTQLPYALTTAFFSFIGFVLAGVIRNWYIVFPITVILMLGLLVFFKLFAQSRSKPVRFLS